MISVIIIIIVSLMAAGGCVFYAWARGNRRQRVVWYAMSIPLVFHAVIYLWIMVYEPVLSARVFPVRLVDIVEHSFLALLTIMLGIADIRSK